MQVLFLFFYFLFFKTDFCSCIFIIIILSFISALFLVLLVIFNIFLTSYRAECERQRAKLVKDDSELIGERIEIQRDEKPV